MMARLIRMVFCSSVLLMFATAFADESYDVGRGEKVLQACSGTMRIRFPAETTVAGYKAGSGMDKAIFLKIGFDRKNLKAFKSNFPGMRFSDAPLLPKPEQDGWWDPDKAKTAEFGEWRPEAGRVLKVILSMDGPSHITAYLNWFET